jgi:integrase
MASLQRRASGLYLLSLWFQRKLIQRSLETHDQSEAERLKTQVEQRLRLLREGTLSLPEGATPDHLWQVLRHGRVMVPLPTLVEKVALETLAERYIAAFPAGSKEQNTLATESIHLNHFKRVLGSDTPVQSIVAGDLRSYINQRHGEKGRRGGTVKPDTIRKELETFRLAWHFALSEGYVVGDCPLKDVDLPKRRRKPPFQTWEQIEAKIARGGISEEQISEFWDCLFLRESEIAEFLRHVKKVADTLPRFRVIYPALCFCAYTGARRSEMFRIAVGDVADGLIRISEKKRDKRVQYTYRHIPEHPELNSILTDWLGQHPGGQHLFCKNGREPLEDKTSREAFKAVTRNSKWAVLRGYHILRHSFASNLARSGRVSQPEIDELMGHQTEEMRRRYQHLFPEDIKNAVSVLTFVSTN